MGFTCEINLVAILGAVLGSIIVTSFCNRRKERPKIYILEPDIGEWLSVKKTPIPQDIIDQDIILTDGKAVAPQRIRYNCEGEAILGYGSRSTIVTHWRPLPKPPEEL